ncbi:hypothetical protein [Streptomyces sp. C8S0]|uniref:hypothetical protein n=1 Tax=Streptomyces sp. C8S0 TaxID=2585716 RepID=UPI001868D217|nr:hypothetical protein [Streptomyces sp. C8S0]
MGFDGDDVAVGPDGVGGQEAEGAAVGADVDEGVPGAEPVAQEGRQVRLPLAEQVLEALDDVAGGDGDRVAGQEPGGGVDGVGAQVLVEEVVDELGLAEGAGAWRT